MTSTNIALELKDVHKSYGKQRALNGLTMQIPAGTICGLVGPNGSGKTTTFGIVGGYIIATSGYVNVLEGGPHDPHRFSGRVTLLPQDCQLSAHTSVNKLLSYFGQLQGMTSSEAQHQSEQWIDRVGLNDRRNAKIKELSHGMKRRIAIAQAFIGNPKLVLLDEPTNGLDPEIAVEIRELFSAQKGQSTLVISSHNLNELETLCDHVVFLEAGRCVRSGSIATVTRRGTLLRITLERAIDAAAIFSSLSTFTYRWDDATLTVEAPSDWSPASVNAQLLPALIQAGAKILEVHCGQSLEEAYLANKQQR